MDPSSEATKPMELNTNDPPPPPHSSPTSVDVVAFAAVPGGMVKTGAPLSPGIDPALAKELHSATKIVPACGTLAQVAVIGPPVHPVVLPTLVTMVPASGRAAVPVTVRRDVELGIFSEHVAGTTPDGGVRHSVVGFAIAAIAPF